MNTGNGLKDTEESHKNDAKKPKQPSKRQVKREKAEKKENEKKEAGRLEAMKKGLNYVSKVSKSFWNRIGITVLQSTLLFAVETRTERMEIRETEANLADG